MPLITNIVRNGEQMKLRWGNFHVAAIILAAAFESEECSFNKPEKIYDTDPEQFACYPDAPFPITREVVFMITSYPMINKTPLSIGAYTLTSRHKFIDNTDGEILSLLPGDILMAYRSW